MRPDASHDFRVERPVVQGAPERSRADATTREAWNGSSGPSQTGTNSAWKPRRRTTTAARPARSTRSECPSRQFAVLTSFAGDLFPECTEREPSRARETSRSDPGPGAGFPPRLRHRSQITRRGRERRVHAARDRRLFASAPAIPSPGGPAARRGGRTSDYGATKMRPYGLESYGPQGSETGSLRAQIGIKGGRVRRDDFYLTQKKWSPRLSLDRRNFAHDR